MSSAAEVSICSKEILKRGVIIGLFALGSLLPGAAVLAKSENGNGQGKGKGQSQSAQQNQTAKKSSGGSSNGGQQGSQSHSAPSQSKSSQSTNSSFQGSQAQTAKSSNQPGSPGHNNVKSPGTGHVPVSFCHRTGSAKNPYVFITTDIQGKINGHTKHGGDIFGVSSEADCPKGTTVSNPPVTPPVTPPGKGGGFAQPVAASSQGIVAAPAPSSGVGGLLPETGGGLLQLLAMAAIAGATYIYKKREMAA